MSEALYISTRETGQNTKHVLIVDDEEAIRDSICLVLSEEGFSCTAASSGPEAIRKTKKDTFDVIIVDYQMSGMNGIQTLRKVRELQSDIHVVLITCYSESDAIREALNAGARHYLLKPLDFDELLDLLASILH